MKERNTMKKLMMSVAIVCAAAIANAAACSWKTGTISFDGNESAATGGTSVKKTVTGYLYYFTGDTAATDYAKAMETISAQDVTTANWAKDYMSKNTAKVTGTTTSYGKLTLADSTSYAENTTLYGVVIGTKTVGDETYYMVNGATVKIGTVDATVLNLEQTLGGNTTSSTDGIYWNAAAAVPEPFSGALALLGMGAIALRRKMKKQKKA